MIVLALLSLALGAILIHAGLSGKSVAEILKSGLPIGSSTPSFGEKSVGLAEVEE
jgi:hypothetical protein